jgi:hypothetical protein
MRGRSGSSRATARACAAAVAVVAAALGTTVTGCAAAAGSVADKPLATGQPTALPRAVCGVASTHALSDATQILYAGKGALTCFDAAARQCRTASIEVTEMGVDTGTNHVFAITAGARPCQVTELSQPYSANGGGSTGTVGSVSCRLRSATNAGVLLSCAGQELMIPARTG